MNISKTKMFSVLSTLILISVAVPAMAQDRGERHQRAGTYHKNAVIPVRGRLIVS